MLHEGGCLCGRIRYAIKGDPRWVASCHCQSCRRATGAAFATFLGVGRENFEVFQGIPMARASSPGVTRCFCPDCGTALTYENDKLPGEVHVLVGSLDNPAEFPPTLHVNVSEKLPWLVIDDGLPQYPHFVGGMEIDARRPSRPEKDRKTKEKKK